MLIFMIEICENPTILSVIYFIKELLKIIYFGVPIILILLISIDFFKSVIANKEDQMNKNVQLMIKRIISTIMLFLVFNIVSFTMNILEEVNLANGNWFDCYENSSIDKIKVFRELYEAERREKEIEEEPGILDLNNSNKVVVSGKKKELAGNDFANTAKKVWNKIVKGDKHFTYRAVYNGKTYYNQIPITNSYCDCSSLVSWVLYEYGYTEFAGKQKKTGYFFNTNFEEKFGWEVIPVKANENVTKKVQVGDILVRIKTKNGKAAGTGGHILIVAKVKGNNITAYDCGTSSFVENGVNPNGVNANWFMKDNRPGKIIRVTKI